SGGVRSVRRAPADQARAPSSGARMTTTTTLAVRPAAGALRLEALNERARSYAEASQSPATVYAYASDWKDFRAFCADHGLCPFPATPQTVCEYVAHL